MKPLKSNNNLKDDNLLEINHLAVSFALETGRVRAIDDVGFSVPKGKTLGLVGESGCGKSVTALSVMRLLPKPSAQIEGGEILFLGRDIVRLNNDQMQEIRGNRISMIFQEPMTALNPVHRIGRQLEEVFRLHFPDMNKKQRQERSMGMLESVGIPDPVKRFREYPHQISGGMRQRVMIAMALACKPELLIADEPTTALDVTIQAQILELIATLQEDTGMSVMFITHDMGVIAEICDDVVVMYAGRVAEHADTTSLFTNPAHPYTRGLLSSIPRLESRAKSRLNVISGMVPGLEEFTEGCRFQNRCPEVMIICKIEQPGMTRVGNGHVAACHLLK